MKNKTIQIGLVGVCVAALATLAGHAYVTYSSWAFSPVVYYVNPQNSDVSPDAAEAALQWAAAAWSNQTHAAFRYYYGGRVTDTSTGFDGRNVVIFRNASSGVAIAGTYSWWDSSGHLLDSDIIVWDANFRFFTGNSGCVEAGIANSAYLEDVMTHEFGHMLGLQHSPIPTATMFPSYSWCSQEMRSLDSDDIAGVEALYPGGGGGGSPARSPNTAPAVSITSPGNGAAVSEGTAVLFTASANDAEDGDLSARVAWTSSLDGPLGAAGSLTRALSVGTHTITASVTDSGGLAGSSNVTVTVTPVCTRANPTVTTTPSGYIWTVAGVPQVYVVRVTNNDAASCGASSFALQPTVPAGWTVSLNSATPSINPGATATATLKLTAPAGTPDGGYGVWLSASSLTSPGQVNVTSLVEYLVSSLSVSVSTDAGAYAMGQTGSVTVSVAVGASAAASAKVTITMTRPDGTTFKRWTPKTNSSGTATVTFKAQVPPGVYAISVVSTKGSASGSAQTQVSFQ